MYPVAAEAAAKMEILARQRVKYVFKDDIVDNPNQDEPEPKGQNLKASRAKAQSSQREAELFFFKPRHKDFLCVLCVFARNIPSVLSRIGFLSY